MRDITLINVKNFETLAPATILSTSPGFTLCILPLPLTSLLFSSRFSLVSRLPLFLTRRKSPTYEESNWKRERKNETSDDDISLIRGISGWNCVCTCDIVRYIRGIYIYIFKKKEREGGIEFYSRQHKPRRSYPIPVKRFCKKARCIKRKRIVCNAFLIRDVLERVLLTKCIIMFHEFIYSKLGIFVISPCSSQLPSRRFFSVLLLSLTLSSYFLFQLLRNKFTGIRLSTSREITRLHNEMYTIVISHEPIFPRDGKYNVINLPFCIDK